MRGKEFITASAEGVHCMGRSNFGGTYFGTPRGVSAAGGRRFVVLHHEEAAKDCRCAGSSDNALIDFVTTNATTLIARNITNAKSRSGMAIRRMPTRRAN